MKFSFGIITSPKSSHYLKKVIKSILKQNIPKDMFEIIVVGSNKTFNSENIHNVDFDEDKKIGWITRKKNLITSNSNYENIVYIHDYVALSKGWYRAYQDFENDFDICMNPILNYDDTRYRDWTLWTDNGNKLDNTLSMRDSECLIPYDVTHLSKFMYISGAYWVAKKKVMEEFPLNEKLSWGEGEDVEWSKRVRKNYEFKLNPNAKVKLLKYKPPLFLQPNEIKLKQILEITNQILS